MNKRRKAEYRVTLRPREGTQRGKGKEEEGEGGRGGGMKESRGIQETAGLGGY